MNKKQKTVKSSLLKTLEDYFNTEIELRYKKHIER